MRALQVFALLVFVSGTLPGADLDVSRVTGSDTPFGCTDAKSATSLIQDFGIDTKAFDDKTGPCSNANPLKRILNALQMIRALRFEDAPPSAIIRGFVPSDYGVYLKNRIQAIAGGGEECNAGWGAFVRYRTHTMSVCPAFLDPTVFNILDRVSTLVHEARHTEGYHHVACETGYLAGLSGGSNGCDETYAEGGSYGVEVEFLARIALRGKNVHPVLKSLARYAALSRLIGGNFNTEPFSPVPLLLLVDNTNGHLVAWDGQIITDSPLVIGPHAQMYPTNGNEVFIALYPQASPNTRRFLDPYSLHFFGNDPVTEEEKSHPELLRNETPTVDYPYFTRKIKLFPNRIEETDLGLSPGVSYRYELPGTDVAVRLLTVLPCPQTGGSAQSGAFVLLSNGNIFEVDRDGDAGIDLNDTGCKWPGDIIAAGRLGSRLYVVDDWGKLNTFQKDGTRVPVKAFGNRRFSQIQGVGILEELVPQ